MQGILALADGRCFEGRAVGTEGVRCMELVTSSSPGVPTSLGDPVLQGQGLVLTTPVVGQLPLEPPPEGKQAALVGLVVRSLAAGMGRTGREGWSELLRRHGVMALVDLDTRALARHLREHGVMHACMGTGALPAAELVARAARHRGLPRRELRRFVIGAPTAVGESRPGQLTVLDLGARPALLRALGRQLGGYLRVPATMSAAELLAMRPGALLVSGGPGDPAEQVEAIATLRALAPTLPVLGVGLGALVLALALGGRTSRMRHGHHGSHHPVASLETGRMAITGQHHGHELEPSSLGEVLEPTHLGLGDGSIEGFRHRSWPVRGVLFHPEGDPGPLDPHGVLAEFLARLPEGTP